MREIVRGVDEGRGKEGGRDKKQETERENKRDTDKHNKQTKTEESKHTETKKKKYNNHIYIIDNIYNKKIYT